MDRRGFVTTGTAGAAAGLAALGGVGSGLVPAFRDPPGWRPGKILPDDTIKLSSNENPLGLAPAAREAVIEALPHANRYPDDYSPPLFEGLARTLGVGRENLTVGAGSTEILQMAVHAYAGPGTPLVVAEPTFEDVDWYQEPLSYELVRVPLTDDLAHDVGRMRDEVEARGGPAVVYLCNPNNPTGTLTPSADVDAWIADAPETTTFLVDEAYFEYVDDPAYWSAVKWVGGRPNVIVARTFSKIFGMAGLRLGYAVAHPDTIRRLDAFVARNNPNVLANAAGIASLADPDLVSRSRAVNDEAKAIARETLEALGLEMIPTHTNFVMHRVGGDLERYIARMADAGIRVGRSFPPMLGWNRLSFGLPEEMERWAGTLRDFRRKGWV